MNTVKDYPTFDLALAEAGLANPVEMKELSTEFGPVHRWKAVTDVVTGDVHGVATKSYVPVQTVDVVKPFNPLLADGTLKGNLRVGKFHNGPIWIQAEYNQDPMVIKGNDIVNKYVMFSIYHDGKHGNKLGPCATRIVCMNTLRQAEKEGGIESVRHTSLAQMKINEIYDSFRAISDQMDKSAEAYRLLASKPVTLNGMKKLTMKTFGLKDSFKNPVITHPTFRKVINLFEHGRGNDMPEIKGTLWAGYNACNEYIQHERGNNAAQRMKSAWYGQGARQDAKAFATALEMAA